MKLLSKISVLLLSSFILISSIETDVYAKSFSKATEKSPCVISAIGDSITYSNTYAAVLDSLPEIVVNNYGMSATQVAGLADHSFVNRTKNMKFKSDIILIFGGTNDYMGKDAMCNPLGMPDSDDITTFFGAYNTMIKNIKKNNPKSRIILVTPIKRLYWDEPNAYGLNLSHYALATQMVANSHNLECIDLFNIQNCDFTGTDKLLDGIHPNASGHVSIASTIYQYLVLTK